MFRAHLVNPGLECGRACQAMRTLASAVHFVAPRALRELDHEFEASLRSIALERRKQLEVEKKKRGKVNKLWTHEQKELAKRKMTKPDIAEGGGSYAFRSGLALQSADSRVVPSTRLGVPAGTRPPRRSTSGRRAR